ncbi:type IV secretion system protein VirB10 [Nitrosospira sp. Nsp18]|uniref:TrbI/VirB10 family protein n=1 Tax=Nitrosospira sp. Nsp18 TaxID=1855334 RepID=UPI0008907199|nr:TrbI/VirB10 family protein [Nitrosospira sp. Nsp18]SDA23355.1 type IV secretion system protein VirB10 [Nitrosospira sp. Nsp18]
MSQTMPPSVSPGQARTGGGRRVNNLPLYLIGIVVAMFRLIVGLVAMDRANPKQTEEETPRRQGNTSLFAKELAGDRPDGIIPASSPVLPEEADFRPANPDLPPVPPSLPSSQHQTDMERIRQMKQQQFEEALKAKTGVQIAQPREHSAPDAASGRPADLPAHTDPAAVYRARLAQLRKASMGGREDMEDSEETRPSESGQPGKPRNNYEDFAGGGEDKWKLDSRLLPPRSPYTVQTTFVIPVTLITGINSTLPGKIFAQVSQDVYDTPTGKHLLVPQGTKLEGVYSSDVAYGQANLLVAGQRFVFPDGKTMDIGAMPGSSGAGYAGLSDQVNNHYVRLFGSALIMSAITAGVSLSQSRNQIAGTFGAPTTNSVLSAALGQQLGRVTSQLISKNLNISPTLEIRPGYRFNVTVTKDMVFSKPYQAFDY